MSPSLKITNFNFLGLGIKASAKSRWMYLVCFFQFWEESTSPEYFLKNAGSVFQGVYKTTSRCVFLGTILNNYKIDIHPQIGGVFIIVVVY